MLRVAAISKIILGDWTGPELNKKAVTVACAMHDIAKPINFVITNQTQYNMSKEDVDNLPRLQTLIKEKYGTEEYDAAFKMCKDVGIEDKSCQIILVLDWSNIPFSIKKHNYESMVSIYSDMRIGPKGVLSLQGRIDDLKRRAYTNDDYDSYLKSGKILEKEMKKNVSLDLDKISDQDLNSYFAELLNMEV
jgi:hypothetical protein